MNDLYAAMLLMLSVSVLLAVLSYGLSRIVGASITLLLLAGAVALLIIYLRYYRDSMVPARFLPFSNLIVLANPTPLLVGSVIGFASSMLPGHPMRRAFLLTPLAVFTFWGSYSPLFAERPEVGNVWMRGVCRQTTNAS